MILFGQDMIFLKLQNNRYNFYFIRYRLVFFEQLVVQEGVRDILNNISFCLVDLEDFVNMVFFIFLVVILFVFFFTCFQNFEGIILKDIFYLDFFCK